MIWTIHRQKTGFQIRRGHQRVGGWHRGRHFFVLDTYLGNRRDRRAVMRKFGFRRREQPRGHYWWMLPESEAGTFFDALNALADMEDGVI